MELEPINSVLARQLFALVLVLLALGLVSFLGYACKMYFDGKLKSGDALVGMTIICVFCVFFLFLGAAGALGLLPPVVPSPK